MATREGIRLATVGITVPQETLEALSAHDIEVSTDTTADAAFSTATAADEMATDDFDCAIVSDSTVREWSTRVPCAGVDGCPVVVAVDDGNERLARDALDSFAAEFVRSETVHGDGDLLAHRVRTAISAATDVDAATHRDVEARRKRLRALFDKAPDAVVLHDADGAVLDVNERLVENLGYSRSELQSMSVADFEAGHDIESLRAFWSELDVGETGTLEGTHRRADGSTFPVEIWLNKLEIDGEVQFLAFARDITERKEHESALQRARDELRQIIDLVPDLLFVKDANGEYLLANETTADYYGLAPDEVVGRTDAEVLPDETEAEAFREQDRHVIDSGEPTHVDREELTTADGETRVLETTKIPFEVAGTDETAVLGYARDITERDTYERELDARRRELRESNERLQQFAYVVSHDLQEPLRMVSSYLDLLESEYSDDLDAEAREYIDFAVDGAERMSRMIDALLSYSRVETRGEEPAPVDAAAVFEEAHRDLKQRIEETNARIEADDLPTVLADRSQLGQLFRNLLSNAIEYAGDEPPVVDVAVERQNGEYVFAVADEGVGIHERDREDIFEVFQRGRNADRGSGTGIGLAICRRIVDRHGGDIWVDSTVGDGTTFYFTLPAPEGDAG
ncbi:sensor box histidine kinase [Natronomonas pharaonis DSM 2160]|uniref:histidine kinase n=1 Tax=Natronomonas pharaonis (strain ATCC 35678 / DSM 2160 / CIP 103997 / JCM 8858 / NBRC 14720 / NCIMB 2260 / Gabara) TaxID=348780 RepID=A0A1U7ETE1_NATPD|nr:PAS domain S-box protein [Natronomonas pharaonis]CAI48163.1 sensor box histidine kinase [Natronomonas pharaonis DSM 2160]